MITWGFATGFTYMVGVYIGWLYFPGNEGLVSGLIIGSLGPGSFIFALTAE